MTPTEKKLAAEVSTAATVLKDALVAYSKAVKALHAKARDKAEVHQFVAQATSMADINKTVEVIKKEQEALLAKLEPTQIIIQPFTLGDVIVPSYVYSPSEKLKAELLNRDDKTWNFVLGQLAAAEQGSAVERRLSGKVFADHHELLEACQGLVALKNDRSWSVTKAK